MKKEYRPGYISWVAMKQRCNNPKKDSYKYYGGRGISYDKSWEQYEGFFHDMGATWEKGLTLGRIDPHKDYSKANCKWETWEEQARNKRNTPYVTYEGIRYSLKQLCAVLGLNYHTVWGRLFYHGLSLDIALTKGPVKRRFNPKSLEGLKALRADFVEPKPKPCEVCGVLMYRSKISSTAIFARRKYCGNKCVGVAFSRKYGKKNFVR